MKIPVILLTLLGTAILGLEAWTLSTVVELKTDVAALHAAFSVEHQQHITKY